MINIISALKSKLSDAKYECIDDKNHQAYENITNIFLGALMNGRSSSIIVSGRRGVGKSRIISKAVGSVRVRSLFKDKFVACTLSGVLHTDDRVAIRALVNQINARASTEINFSESSSFPEQLRLLVSDLKQCSLCLFIILDEFDLFVGHKNQTLLYNLLELVQSQIVPVCIIGVTCRMDLLELLEKRVKSRFSHRIEFIMPPLEMIMESDSELRQLLKEALCLREEFANSHKSISKNLLVSWNKKVDTFLSEDEIYPIIRSIFECSISIKRFLNFIAIFLALCDNESSELNMAKLKMIKDIMRHDCKSSSIASLSTLEQVVLTAVIKLNDIKYKKVVNFPRIYNAYQDFCRSHCPAYTYEKAVVMKTVDNLIDQGFLVKGRSAKDCTVYSNGACSLKYTAGASTLSAFEPIVSFVSQDCCKKALNDNSYCPMELQQWLHSRTL
ncbi:origin recognition complex subunit 4 [Cichlidogyrus casuarinus]|uniref:Origin recognition complex subunit 4 n=1 Tax=Cichlidogyrus casuarinus TaxID=1844966 RepID=A0ABD2QNK6_9PLAT